MSRDTLNEREFELINIIGAKLAANQRDLSRHLELSLGMTNMIVRRLIAKGYIRIRQLNKRKVEYLLTPKGFAEKTRKSIKYTIKTINSIGLIKERLKKIIHKLYEQGERKFYLLGDSDLVILVEREFRENFYKDCELIRVKEIPEEKVQGAILICTEKAVLNDRNKDNVIDFIEELAKDNEFINHNIVL